MKKAFTLIEILVVFFIILILTILTLRFGWNYIVTMQTRNDKEGFVLIYNSTLSKSLSKIYVNGTYYTSINLILSNNSDYVNTFLIDNSGNKVLFEKFSFSKSIFSGFVYGNNIYASGNIIFNSYNLGCNFNDGVNKFGSGDLFFSIKGKENLNEYCFKINLNSCKLIEYRCH